MYKPEHKTTEEMATGSYLSIITLNVNGLNAPTKRQRLAEWIQKKTPYMLSTRNPPQNKGHQKTENKELEKDISKSILSHMSITTPAFFWSPFV